MTRVVKPWGWEQWFAHTSKYVGKIIFIKKGHRLSKQYHRFKHETIYADQGAWLLEIAGRKVRMKPGMAMEVKPGVIHRFCAPYENVRLIEVSTPQVKDVIRLEDDYGRGALTPTLSRPATEPLADARRRPSGGRVPRARGKHFSPSPTAGGRGLG